MDLKIINTNKTKKSSKDDEDKVQTETEYMDTDKEQEGGSSRRSSFSSCSEGTLERDRTKKRKIRDNDDSSDKYKETEEPEENVTFMRNKRGELERFLFSENNKVSKPAIKFILEKWSEIESKVTELLVQQSKLLGRIEGKETYPKAGNSGQTSYAEATKKEKLSRNYNTHDTNKKATNNVLIIRDINKNDQSTGDKVKERALKVLKDKGNEIRIGNTRLTRDNGLLIETGTNEDANLIRTIDFKQAGLKLETPRKVGPCIVIFDIDKDKTQDEIREDLWCKNLLRLGLNRVEHDGKILFRFNTKGKDPKYVNWILEIPPEIYDIILNRGRLFLEWKAHKVREFINISRCYKCLGFGHSAKNCGSEDNYCGHCGEKGHVFKECKTKTSKPKCACCLRSKRKNTEHNIRDKTCPEYLRQLDRYRARTTYI